MLIVATIGCYAAVLAATFFGLVTLVSGLLTMPILAIKGKIKPGPVPWVIPVCVNFLLWIGIAALWGVVLGGPMPVLLFASVFAVYGLSAKDPNLTPEGFHLAGAEQTSVVLAAVAHVILVGLRWF